MKSKINSTKKSIICKKLLLAKISFSHVLIKFIIVFKCIIAIRDSKLFHHYNKIQSSYNPKYLQSGNLYDYGYCNNNNMYSYSSADY